MALCSNLQLKGRNENVDTVALPRQPCPAFTRLVARAVGLWWHCSTNTSLARSLFASQDPLEDKLSKQKNIDSFDTSKMGNELAQAVEYDRKYYLTDEAKKRAITKAVDYDEFKNLVACADLKPLSSKEVREIAQGERQVNRAAVDNRRSRVRGGKKSVESQAFVAVQPTSAPQSASEFERNWGRHCVGPKEKFE